MEQRAVGEGGAKAGRNAGGRLESLPHKNSVDHKRSLHHKIRLPHKTRLRTRMSEPHQMLAPLRRLVKAHRPTTGKTAGVASLAACSTEGAFGWKRGRWVKGAKA